MTENTEQYVGHLSGSQRANPAVDETNWKILERDEMKTKSPELEQIEGKRVKQKRKNKKMKFSPLAICKTRQKERQLPGKTRPKRSKKKKEMKGPQKPEE